MADIRGATMPAVVVQNRATADDPRQRLAGTIGLISRHDAEEGLAAGESRAV